MQMASAGGSEDELECLSSILADGANGRGADGPGQLKVKAETVEDEADGGPSAAGSDDESGDGCATEDDETVGSRSAGQPLSAKGQRAAKPGANEGVVCCICGMSDQDLDMADNSEQRLTPFGCLGSSASNSSSGAFAVCGHCEGLLRYQLGNRSAAAVVQHHVGNPSAKAAYLRSLAIILGLKRAEQQSRVPAVTLDRYSNFLSAYDRIHDMLLTRAGLQEIGRTVGKGQVVALDDYIQCFGNPLINGDTITGGLANERGELFVLTDKLPNEGRYDLSAAVASASNSLKDEVLRRLSGLRVDDLASCTSVKHVVAEYSSRQHLQREMKSRRAVKQESDDEGGACNNMDGDDGLCSRSSAFRHPRSTCSRSAPSVSEGPGSGRKRAPGAPFAEVASPAAAAATPAAPAAPMPPPPSTPTPTTTPSKQPEQAAKSADRILKRVSDLVAYCGIVGWSSHVRGKAKTCDNVTKAIKKELHVIVQAEREDLLSLYTKLENTLDAAKQVFIAARFSRVSCFDELRMHGFVRVLGEHLAEHRVKDEQGSIVERDPALRLVQARRRALINKPCPAHSFSTSHVEHRSPLEALSGVMCCLGFVAQRMRSVATQR